MQTFSRPKRNTPKDNLWGSLACIGLALLIYLPNSGYPAGCSARAGVTAYLWLCGFPAMTIGALLLAAILFPVASALVERLSWENRMGFGNVSLLSGVACAFCMLFVIPEAITQAFLSGIIAGLVFTLARDYLAVIPDQTGRNP